MAERFNAAVLKTVEGKTSGGSNPSLSSRILEVASWVDGPPVQMHFEMKVGTC
jgi:hypothetical protein